MVSIVNSQHCPIQMQNSTYLSLEALMSACPDTLLSLEAALVKSKEATGLTRWAALCSGLPRRARCREALSSLSLEGSNASLFGDSSSAFCLTVRPAEAGAFHQAHIRGHRLRTSSTVFLLNVDIVPSPESNVETSGFSSE